MAVVDGAAVNLTPLGKFVMPPPMFEKQILLPYVPKSVALYGNRGVAYIDQDRSLHVFDCENDPATVKKYDIGTLLPPVSTGDVAKRFTVTQVINHGGDKVLVLLSGHYSDKLVLLGLPSGQQD